MPLGQNCNERLMSDGGFDLEQVVHPREKRIRKLSVCVIQTYNTTLHQEWSRRCRAGLVNLRSMRENAHAPHLFVRYLHAVSKLGLKHSDTLWCRRKLSLYKRATREHYREVIQVHLGWATNWYRCEVPRDNSMELFATWSEHVL